MDTELRPASLKSRASTAVLVVSVVGLLCNAACQNELPGESLDHSNTSAPTETEALNPNEKPLSETPTADENAVQPLPGHARLVTVEEIKARGRRIYCVPQAPGTINKVGPVIDTPWTIEGVAADAPCEGRMRLRHQNGHIEMLPLPPGAYYFATGRNVGEQTLIVLTHIAHGTFLPERNGRLYTTEVDPTIIALTKKANGWSNVFTLVDKDEAVWATALTSKLELLYLQDSLFEHLLLVQEGRPDTDGLYKTQLSIHADGAVAAGEAKRIGDYLMSLTKSN